MTISKPNETAVAAQAQDLPARAPLLFAVQREDPRLEEMLLDRLGPGPKRFFGVTAAGDTLLQLAGRSDLSELVGADFDPRESAWAQLKAAAARTLNRKDFCRLVGISQIDPATREGLLGRVLQALPAEHRAWIKSQRGFFASGGFDHGTFEQVFASWREFVERFIASREDVQCFFEGDAAIAETMMASPLWPVSFELFFHQDFLHALFGHRAIQHAPPGSYPRHFRTRFEAALRQPRAFENPHLSHVLRGRYGALDQTAALPDFLLPERFEKLPRGLERVRFFEGDVVSALLAHPGPYQLIQLSNILDWSSEAESEAMAQPVLEHLAPGGYLLVRQLNNVRPLPQLWSKALDFDPVEERALHAADRSFFYSAIRVGRKP